MPHRRLTIASGALPGALRAALAVAPLVVAPLVVAPLVVAPLAAQSAARPSARPAAGKASGKTAEPSAVRTAATPSTKPGVRSARGAATPAAKPGAKPGAAPGATKAPAAPRVPLRLEVAIGERRLYAVRGQDTLLATTAAVASQETLSYAGRTWTFHTPKGARRVLQKQSDPWWTPPDWFYAETARRHDLKIRYLAPGRTVTLTGGRRLVVRDSAVGLVLPGDPAFQPLPEDEHVVFGDTLFVPPIGTRHRRISGQLGAFRLDLGDGFLIHGTPDERTIGTASTHGCVRLDAVALAWVYEHVPVGTTVVIR